MSAWLVAILVALVGLAGGLIGTFARIAHERGTDLRARMLDAADDFVTLLTRAHEAIEAVVLPTGLWLTVAWLEMTEEMSEERQRKVKEAQAAASAAWEPSRQRVPRITLLFGVETPAEEAAKRADDALGAAFVVLSEAYAESFDPEIEPLDADLVSGQATEHLEIAASALREFSAAAHAAITGERWAWLTQLRVKRLGGVAQT